MYLSEELGIVPLLYISGFMEGYWTLRLVSLITFALLGTWSPS